MLPDCLISYRASWFPIIYFSKGIIILCHIHFSAGGRLLSRRFTNTSRFVVSSQVWVHTIPTRDCDILLTFPARTDDNVLMWLLSRLRTRTPELAVHVRHHSNTGVYGFYITSSYEQWVLFSSHLSHHCAAKWIVGIFYLFENLLTQITALNDQMVMKSIFQVELYKHCLIWLIRHASSTK